MAFETVVTAGLLVLLAGLLATIGLYFWQKKALASNRAASFAKYVGVALVVGLLAYAVGLMVGIYAACWSPGAGNLCGLYGAFGTGPLLAGVAMFLFGLIRVRKAGAAQGRI